MTEDTDDGQISLLLLGLAALSLMLVLVFVAASSVHVEHRRLLDVADAVAMDAADAVDARTYYATDGITQVPVTAATVRDSVTESLRRQPPVPGCENVRVEVPTGVTDTGQVVVTLACTARPAFAGRLAGAVPLGVDLQVTTSARARTDG